MGKPSGKTFDEFCDKFYKINEQLGKKQYIIPYLMSSHPGSTLKDAIQLAEYLRDIHYQPEQVQDFYPTPGTLSTTMFYTGLDPRTMKPVYVPKTKREKAMQRALLQYRNPKKYDIVYEAPIEGGREDLIGFGPKCLIKPKDSSREQQGNRRSIKQSQKSITNNRSNNRTQEGRSTSKIGKGKQTPPQKGEMNYKKYKKK